MFNFSDIYELQKKSASPTVQYFAKYKGEDVVVKAHFKINDLDAFERDVAERLITSGNGNEEEALDFVGQITNAYRKSYDRKIKGVEYENKIYSEIVKVITDTNISENFVEFVTLGESNLPDFIQTFYSQEKYDTRSEKGLIEGIKHFAKRTGHYLREVIVLDDNIENTPLEVMSVLLECYTKHSQVNFLVTKRVMGDENKIMNIASSNSISEDEFKEILFQIFHTLYLMETLRLQHNDLHLENILIERLPRKRKMHYKVDGQDFVLMTKYLVRIYDWDTSYVDDPYFGINEMIDHDGSKLSGILNEFIKNYDYFVLVCELLQMCEEYDDENWQNCKTYTIYRSNIFHLLFSSLLREKILRLDKNGAVRGLEDHGKFINKRDYLALPCRPTEKEMLKRLPDLRDVMKHPLFAKFRVVMSSTRKSVKRRLTIPSLLRSQRSHGPIRKTSYFSLIQKD